MSSSAEERLPQNWAFRYLDDEHMAYATELLAGPAPCCSAAGPTKGCRLATRPWPRPRSSTG